MVDQVDAQGWREQTFLFIKACGSSQKRIKILMESIDQINATCMRLEEKWVEIQNRFVE
jgi:hypothetical protein